MSATPLSWGIVAQKKEIVKIIFRFKRCTETVLTKSTQKTGFYGNLNPQFAVALRFRRFFLGELPSDFCPRAKTRGSIW
jgi:hypothetical protein